MTSSCRRYPTSRAWAATAALLLAAACSGGGDEPTPDEPGSSQASQEPTTEATSDPTEEPTEEQPAETDTPRVTGDSYSYAVPEGWEDILDTPEAEGADTFVRSTTPVGAFATNVNTVISAGSGMGTLAPDLPQLQQLRKEFAQSARTQTGVLPRPIEDTELDGSFTIGHTVDEFKGRGTTLTITQYATVRDDVSYVVTLTAAADDAENADTALATVMESWAWE